LGLKGTTVQTNRLEMIKKKVKKNPIRNDKT